MKRVAENSPSTRYTWKGRKQTLRTRVGVCFSETGRWRIREKRGRFPPVAVSAYGVPARSGVMLGCDSAHGRRCRVTAPTGTQCVRVRWPVHHECSAVQFSAGLHVTIARHLRQPEICITSSRTPSTTWPSSRRSSARVSAGFFERPKRPAVPAAQSQPRALSHHRWKYCLPPRIYRPVFIENIYLIARKNYYVYSSTRGKKRVRKVGAVLRFLLRIFTSSELFLINYHANKCVVFSNACRQFLIRKCNCANVLSFAFASPVIDSFVVSGFWRERWFSGSSWSRPVQVETSFDLCGLEKAEVLMNFCSSFHCSVVVERSQFMVCIWYFCAYGVFQFYLLFF